MHDPTRRRSAGGGPPRRSPALVVAAMAILVLVSVGCSEASRDSVKSAAASVGSSVDIPSQEPDVGGGGATQEPVPTEAPVPTSAPAPTKDKNNKKKDQQERWWLLAIALALIAIVIALVIRSRGKHRTTATWASRANETYAKAAALHDRLVALGASAVAGPAPPGQQAEVDRMIDDVASSVYALDADAPGEGQRGAVTGLSTSLAGVRSATDLVFTTSGAGGDPQAAASTLNGRLVDLEAALRAFRSTI